jgi:hypothetical protein
MSHNHRPRRVASISTVAALEDLLLDCVGSDDYVAVIRVLASLLDSVGPIAEESIAALLSFGDAAIPAMRGCIDSYDYDMIRHGHIVLAHLGDEASNEWLCDDDCERMSAYLERMGFSDLEWDGEIANETDEEDGVA